MTVSVRFGTPWLLRELSIDVVHEQLRSTIYEQSISPVDDTMAEDLIVTVIVSEANNSVADELQMNPNVTHVHKRGT